MNEKELSEDCGSEVEGHTCIVVAPWTGRQLSVEDAKTRVPVITLGQILSTDGYESLAKRISDASAEITSFFEWEGDISGLPIDNLYERKCRLYGYLANLGYGAPRAHDLVKDIQTVIRRAERAGWEPDQQLSAEWQSVKSAGAGACIVLIRHFGRTNVSPAQVTRDLIYDWLDRSVIARIRTFYAACRLAWSFELLLLSLKFDQIDPNAASKRFSIRLKDFSSGLRYEVISLLNYRQGKWSEIEDREDWKDIPDYALNDEVKDRRRSGRRRRKVSNTIRPVTAAILEHEICRLVGFLILTGRPAECLQDLFTKDNFRAYKDWLLKDRGIPFLNLNLRFRSLIAAARLYPLLRTRSKWTTDFMNELPNETIAQRKLRNAKKCIPYSYLLRIPEIIRKEMQELVVCLNRTKEGSETCTHLKRQIAKLGQREFLMRFMLSLPWRARNICNCRIGTNLIYHPCPAYGVNKPSWVVELEAKIPGANVWQYKFTASETKAGRTIHCILPKHLIDPLEEFLELRKILVRRGDPGTLFVSERGKRLSEPGLRLLTCEITLLYAGGRVPPKVLHDQFALAYLVEYNTDFSGLADHLWHRDVFTTYLYYATCFDPSFGTEIMENWYAERRAREEMRGSIQNHTCATIEATRPDSRV